MNPLNNHLTKLKHRQYLLYLLLFSFATIILWLAIGLVTSQTKSGIEPALKNLAKPLTPTLNEEVINRLEQKQIFSESDLAKFPIYKIIKTTDGKSQVIVTIETEEEALTPTPPPGNGQQENRLTGEQVASQSAVATSSAAL